MKLVILFILLSFSTFSYAHEGHQKKQAAIAENVQEDADEADLAGRPATWTQWVGSLHLILLHFPIALINMLALAEVLYIWLKRPLFEDASRFLAVSAAVLSPPTALLGFIHSYSAPYGGLMETFLFWHMWTGFLTALLAVFAALIRVYKGPHAIYYGSLSLLVLLVNAVGYFGGAMTFGPYHFSPPL